MVLMRALGFNLQPMFQGPDSKLNQILAKQEVRPVALDADSRCDSAGRIFQVEDRLGLEVGILRRSVRLC